MIAEFHQLTNSEMELMLKAPILACILIAGADNHIDNKEIKKSIEMAKEKLKKSKSSPLAKFYLIVAEDFEDKLKIVLQSYPHQAEERNKMIEDELGLLNDVFPKLEKQFAIDYYHSIRDIAVKIAESSGGLLGLKSVGEEEARLIDLPMIKDPTIK